MVFVSVLIFLIMKLCFVIGMVIFVILIFWKEFLLSKLVGICFVIVIIGIEFMYVVVIFVIMFVVLGFEVVKIMLILLDVFEYLFVVWDVCCLCDVR